MLTRNALGNLINRYKAVLGKCRLLNVFGSLAVAGMLVAGGAGIAAATEIEISADTNVGGMTPSYLENDGAQFKADVKLTIDNDATAKHVITATDNTGTIDIGSAYTLTVTDNIGASGAVIKAITGAGNLVAGGDVTAKALTLSGTTGASTIGGTLTLTDGTSSVKNLTTLGGLNNKAASTLTVAAGELVLNGSASFANAGTLKVGSSGSRATLDLRGATVTNTGTITVDGKSGGSAIPSDNYATLNITSLQLAALHAEDGKLNVGGSEGGFVH
ncbi:MAG: hypothetical protein LBO64_02790, partial [Desulfovibrio sp.]|nr:hypothetical protein [Desulfovibrio sp.]